MTLLTPWCLRLLVPVALLAARLRLHSSDGASHAVRFASLPTLRALVPRRPGWRRHLPAGLHLLVLGLLALSVARPETDVKVPRETPHRDRDPRRLISMQATGASRPGSTRQPRRPPRS